MAASTTSLHCYLVTIPRRVTDNGMIVSGRLVLDDRVEVGRITVEDGVIVTVEPVDGASSAGHDAGPFITPEIGRAHV